MKTIKQHLEDRSEQLIREIDRYSVEGKSDKWYVCYQRLLEVMDAIDVLEEQEMRV